jgi:hypothetical protein
MIANLNDGQSAERVFKALHETGKFYRAESGDALFVRTWSSGLKRISTANDFPRHVCDAVDFSVRRALPFETIRGFFLHPTRNILPVLRAVSVPELEIMILGHIRQFEHASYLELEHFLSEHNVEVAGNHEIACSNNIITWINLSDAVSTALLNLLDSKRLFESPTSLLVYLQNQKWPELPVLHSYPKEPLKTPHWLPVVLSTKNPEALHA